jgi:2-polyprenyl-6-methoxyphenol hydroxylase-like FAD-dependent oxidoreductase
VGDRILIIGAGFAGLATALALKGSRSEVTIIERDSEPPECDPGEAFDRWSRPGVPQFRHAHMFLARLQTLLRDKHPELLAELRDAGLELSSLDEILPESHRTTYRPMPDDGDLVHLCGRRPTFEYVLRRHVGRLPHVRFLHSSRVEGLLADSAEKQVTIRGLVLNQAGKRRVVEADLVVDASGKRTRAPEWLKALGVRVAVEKHASNRIYSCRHYRLISQEGAPQRSGSGQNLDSFGYATFYAEHGHFAITLSCPVQEREFAEAMRRPEGFDAVCDRIAVLARWKNRSEVTSKVLGAGGFENRWTRYGVRGGRTLLAYFAVGDSQIETNPIYGRGCASAFVQAELFAEVLAASSDASTRARKYYARTRALMKPHFDFCVAADRMLDSQGRLSRGEAISLTDRVIKYAFEEAWIPAMKRNQLVAREMIKALEMRELSSVWLRIAVLLHLALAWVITRFARGKRRAARPEFGHRKVLTEIPHGFPGGASSRIAR